MNRLILLGLVVIGLFACSDAENEMPADLAVVVDEVRADMVTALPHLTECVSEATISHAWDLEDRAKYFRDSGTVVVRVPATEPQLRVSIVHELAHHVDLGCDLAPRADFLRTQGLPPDVPWNEGASWEETPSEQFAVAVAQVVTGSNDPLRPVTISGETEDLIKDWGVPNVDRLPAPEGVYPGDTGPAGPNFGLGTSLSGVS